MTSRNREIAGTVMGMLWALGVVVLATSSSLADDVGPDGLAEIPAVNEMADLTEPVDPWALAPLEGDVAIIEDPALALDVDASDGNSPEVDEAALASDVLEAEQAPAETSAASSATTLSAVNVQTLGDGELLELAADGSIGSAVTFTLENPDRLVIDLPDMKSRVANSRIEVGTSRVGRIRVGQHDDKVRIVVDSGGADMPFEGRRVASSASGLWVALGSGSELDIAFEQAVSMAPSDTVAASMAEAGDETVAEASAPIETEAPATPDTASTWSGGDADASAVAEPVIAEPTTVYGVEFEAQSELDRLVIAGSEPIDYLVYEPDAETYVLSITNAVIDPRAEMRLAPEAAGPVSLITAFAQPDVEIDEVRIVVKRAANLVPEVTQRGSLLIIDFPHTGALAVRPPVFRSDAGETMVADSGSMVVDSEGNPVADDSSIDLGGSAPAAIDPLGSDIDLAGSPASLEPPASIDILQEGGLIDGKEYTGRRISLDFKEVDIADVLRLIAEVSDLNVIAGDEVKGRVTIRLVDVPWDQALDIILLTKGLGFMRIGNVLRIAPTDVISQEEEARLQERRAKERLEDLVVKLQPVNYADAKDISRMVKELLSERGTVNVDARTNTLVLKDIPSVIDEATALIKAIDTQTPQVMIEAKIVEAKLKFSREFGAVWSVGVQPLSDGWDSSSLARRDIGTDMLRLRPSQLAGADGATNGAVFANPITTLPTAMANMGAFLLDEKINLDVQLQAAEVNGDGKVISSPRVVTLDNSKAKIEQGVSIPFQTFENGDAQLEFVDAVLKLDVTPHITANNSIIMKIKVTRNAPDDSVFTMTGSPAIAKNEVDTETLVKDGQTLVLGGIYTIAKSHRQSRVPYLHRIPILGGAFRNDEISDDRQELLIFVTPRIVRDESFGS
ncbi:MAG: type IV pilus secretin PilQ [Deltaproteobacteria bacterium]|nr:type IV pilus secretin PilQ [Deltaproteobacteria bacterium]